MRDAWSVMRGAYSVLLFCSSAPLLLASPLVPPPLLLAPPLLVSSALRLLCSSTSRFHQPPIKTIALHQFSVRSRFSHSAVIQHHDAIGRADGVEPVRDDERAAADQESLQGGLDLRLALRVEVRRGFVEDHQRRVHQEGARQGDPLRLSPAEPRAPLADDGLIALGQCADEVIGAGLLRGLDQVILPGPRPPQADVLGYGQVEQVGQLRHPGDGWKLEAGSWKLDCAILR